MADKPEVHLFLDQVVATVTGSKKYGGLCSDTIRRIAARELSAHPRAGLKDVVKATRRGLHQVYGAFEAGPDYEAAYNRLEAAYRTGTEAAIRSACREAMALHGSTRERLPILDEFYARIFAQTGVPGSILDLGCGLNPLTLPWMGLPLDARYEAFDVGAADIQFLNRFLALAGRETLVRWQDVLVQPPDHAVDLALLLKTSPTLERQQKGSTGRLIAALHTRWVVVSFAVKSLGGREKGMERHYRAEFLKLAESRHWLTHELVFETELVFVVEHPNDGAAAAK